MLLLYRCDTIQKYLRELFGSDSRSLESLGVTISLCLIKGVCHILSLRSMGPDFPLWNWLDTTHILNLVPQDPDLILFGVDLLHEEFLQILNVACAVIEERIPVIRGATIIVEIILLPPKVAQRRPSHRLRES